MFSNIPPWLTGAVGTVLGGAIVAITAVIMWRILSKTKGIEAALQASEGWERNFNAKEAELKLFKETEYKELQNEHKELTEKYRVQTEQYAELRARPDYREIQASQNQLIEFLKTSRESDDKRRELDHSESKTRTDAAVEIIHQEHMATQQAIHDAHNEQSNVMQSVLQTCENIASHMNQMSATLLDVCKWVKPPGENGKEIWRD